MDVDVVASALSVDGLCRIQEKAALSGSSNGAIIENQCRTSQCVLYDAALKLLALMVPIIDLQSKRPELDHRNFTLKQL